MANLVGWGVLLVIVGLLLTFSNVFGFVVGAPIVWLGVLLIVAGVVVGIAHFFVGGARRLARGPRTRNV
jgi:hypothetical protein